ncbi:MAG TPA: hypothetical protein VNT99_12455, partial [Methylomirabilota bacterium]|nr:hypothetical protein [Methylomirabilota bacterium]
GGTNERGHVVSLHSLDPLSRRPVVSFLHGKVRPLAAALSADGRVLATGTEKAVRIWNATNGALLHELPASQPVHFLRFIGGARSESTNLLAVTTDAALLYSGGSSWNLSWEMPGTAGDAIILAALSSDHTQLAAATEAGSILLLALPGPRPWRVITNAHQNVIRSLRFNASGSRLVSAAADAAHVWNWATADRTITISGGGALLHAEFSPDGWRIVTASREGVARIWDTRTARPIGAPMVHPSAINRVCFNPDGSHVLSASDDGTTQLWSATDGHSLAQTFAAPQPVSSASFSADGRMIVSVAEHGAAGVFSILGGNAAQSFRTQTPLSREAVFSADQLPAAELTAFLSGRGDEALDVSADQQWVATGSRDHSARLWNRQTKRLAAEPLPHDAAVNCVRFSGDGTLLVTSTVERKLRVWSVPSGRPLTDWLTCEESISQVAFSADNALVITAEGEVWKFHPMTDAKPEWLPALAEAIAGLRYLSGRLLEPVPPAALNGLRLSLRSSADTNWITIWARDLLYDLPTQNPN